ncbi:MAG: hypothetical protein GX550_05255 [Syntrophomonadaceae bacterium]|nr:hypothetical protein [Syntrophomonadaceae bacterium]
MGRLPDYIGVSAFGIKMGIIVPGSDLIGLVCQALKKCDQDGFLDDGDTVCITESVLARAQNNYVLVEDIAAEVKERLKLHSQAKVGVLFPILSRNRFSLIMKGIAAAVPEGQVIVQLSYPADEVGNQLLPVEYCDLLENRIITVEEIGENRFKHPITNVDYIELYYNIIAEQGAKPHIILSNDCLKITEYDLDGIIVANIHNRFRTLEKTKSIAANCITLQDICNQRNGAWSEWGLLGSNLSSGNKLKLAPREADQFADELQEQISAELGKYVEVLVYGDGAYRDPSTGIYELADPQPAFGMTRGLRGKYREGLKYKYLVDKMLEEGVDIAHIEELLNHMKSQGFNKDSLETEGTTPRRVEDLIASLADLISGSADAGTPLILVKNFLK